MINTAALLEARMEARISWEEPYPACGPEGNTLDAHVTLSATVHDCINMMRRIAKRAGRQCMGNDQRFLMDFIELNYAKVEEKYVT